MLDLAPEIPINVNEGETEIKVAGGLEDKKWPVDQPVAIICDNGRSRSKIVKKMLEEMGFERVYAFGANRLGQDLSDEVLREVVGRAARVIVVSDDLVHQATSVLKANGIDGGVVSLGLNDGKFHSLCYQWQEARSEEVKGNFMARINQDFGEKIRQRIGEIFNSDGSSQVEGNK